jgi:hypothetical protein
VVVHHENARQWYEIPWCREDQFEDEKYLEEKSRKRKRKRRWWVQGK